MRSITGAPIGIDCFQAAWLRMHPRTTSSPACAAVHGPIVPLHCRFGSGVVMYFRFALAMVYLNGVLFVPGTRLVPPPLVLPLARPHLPLPPACSADQLLDSITANQQRVRRHLEAVPGRLPTLRCALLEGPVHHPRPSVRWQRVRAPCGLCMVMLSVISLPVCAERCCCERTGGKCKAWI